MLAFREKPVEIGAVRWDGSNTAEVADFMAASPGFGSDGQGAAWVDIHTLEGTMRADKGDWIIRGIQGELYPCKPDIFAASYEPVQAPNVSTLTVHIAGPDIQVGPLLRQRCAWCGTGLVDYDLDRIAVPEGQDPRPATWPVGDLVAVDGNASYVVAHEDGEQLPAEACAVLDDVKRTV